MTSQEVEYDPTDDQDSALISHAGDRHPLGGEIVVKSHVIEFSGSASERTRVYLDSHPERFYDLMSVVLEDAGAALADPELLGRISELTADD